GRPAEVASPLRKYMVLCKSRGSQGTGTGDRSPTASVGAANRISLASFYGRVRFLGHRRSHTHPALFRSILISAWTLSGGANSAALLTAAHAAALLPLWRRAQARLDQAV